MEICSVFITLITAPDEAFARMFSTKRSSALICPPEDALAFKKFALPSTHIFPPLLALHCIDFAATLCDVWLPLLTVISMSLASMVSLLHRYAPALVCMLDISLTPARIFLDVAWPMF